MDCEKFETVMIDELFGELDELTSAAAKRHLAGCARCSARMDGLRATRRVASVLLVPEPAGLESRILAATDGVSLPALRRPRLARAISLAGSWAMRPQTAMAAVFLVMIGTSVLLLRGKSARAPFGDEVTVTEQGTPAPAAQEPAPDPIPLGRRTVAAAPPAVAPAEERAQSTFATPPKSAPPSAGVARGAADLAYEREERNEVALDERFNAALRSYRAGRFEEAARAFEALPSTDPNAPDLWAARSIRDGKGCRTAATRFDKTAARHRRSPAGWDALFEGGLCYRSLGELAAARSRFTALLDVDSHKDRARTELDQMDAADQSPAGSGGDATGAVVSRSRASAAAPAAPAAPPAAAAAPARASDVPAAAEAPAATPPHP